MTHAPALVRFSGPITRRLLGAGMPMGPNTLLTVRGRVSGQPRTAPVAVAEIEGRRWVVGTFGEVHWVRNLRAAREAEVRIDGRMERVEAVELNAEEATAFFRDTLAGFVRDIPFVWRVFTRLLLRLSAPEILTDPARAASLRPVFELRRPNRGT
jgi:deazaflavin-dependent oxidoreductase (nitroreductase family)